MMHSQALARVEEDRLFFSPVSRRVYDHWQRLALQRGGVPFREDLNPADVPGLLPYLFIVEKIRETGRFFFRLSGTAIRDIMGAENTRHFLDELLHGDDLATVAAMFDQVLGQGVCIRSIEGLTYSDRSYLRVEIVRLPLRAADGDCRLVLGCLSRIGNDDRPTPGLGQVKDKQVIQIENDVLPRKAF